MIDYPHSQNQEPAQLSALYSPSSALISSLAYISPAVAVSPMAQVESNSTLPVCPPNMRPATDAGKKPKQFTPLPRPARAKPLPQLPHELILDKLAAPPAELGTPSCAVKDMGQLISEIDGLIEESRKSPTSPRSSPASIALKEYIAQRTRKGSDVSDDIPAGRPRPENPAEDALCAGIPCARSPQSPAQGLPPLLYIPKRSHSNAWRETLGDSH
ncbi:hypothetical protein HDU82_008519 [Entophlyctis luteolus]|nr:hypothetical protein HDU82_008519 [Entophlyctis luteolus]